MQHDNITPISQRLTDAPRVPDVHARYRYKLARLREDRSIEYRYFVGSYAEIPNGWVYVERSAA